MARPKSSMPSHRLVGIMPAGGKARRVSPLPCSKEIFPVGFHTNKAGRAYPRVVCFDLLDQMQCAGAEQVYVVLRQGKWDIPTYLGGRTPTGLPLAYLVLESTAGVPYTVDTAYPFVKEARVLFGFPDILLTPSDACNRLLRRQETTEADLVLGLFPTANPHKADMVALDTHGRCVEAIHIKPQNSTLTFAWILAIWTPTFTRFLHDLLASDFPKNEAELYMGHVFQLALNEGLAIEAVPFDDGTYIDVGTPDELMTAVRNAAQRPASTE